MGLSRCAQQGKSFDVQHRVKRALSFQDFSDGEEFLSASSSAHAGESNAGGTAIRVRIPLLQPATALWDVEEPA